MSAATLLPEVEEEVLVPLMGTSASVHSSWRAEVQERLGRASTATSECSVDSRYYNCV